MPESETTSPSQRRRRHRGPGFLTHVIGIFGGGALGLCLGYWLLNYIGGPRFNFFGVPLPYIEHTQPGWVDSSQESPQLASVPDDRPRSLPSDDQGGWDSKPDENLPKAFEPVEVKPAPLAAGVVRGRLAYTPQAFSEALDAVGCETCDSQGKITKIEITGRRFINGKTIESKREVRRVCDACGGKPYGGELTADVFTRLSHLGDVITMVERDDAIRRRSEAIGKILLLAAGQRDQLEALGRQATQRLADADRQGHGIALTGQFLDRREDGELHVYRVRLFESGEVVEVASTVSMSGLSPEGTLIVIGTIVEDPQENLGGYEGQEEQVVLMGYYYRLGPAQ